MNDPGMLSTRAVFFAIMAACSAPAWCFADSDDEPAASYAIQNREYKLAHEINATLGVLPLNAFTKGLTVGGGYTYHFNDFWAWEIAQFQYSFGVDTDLKKELLQNFQVQPTQVESVNFFGSS